MLAALIRQAQHTGLVVEPGFAPKEIRWMANIHGGRLTGVISLLDGKKGMTYPQCPEMGQPEMMALPKALNKSQAAHFLADTCSVVALLPALDRDGNIKSTEAEVTKSTEKHETYLEFLERASEDIPEFKDVLNILKDEAQLEQLRTELARHGAKLTDKLSFTVGETDLLKSDLWHDWWRTFRRETFARASSETGGMLDFTSGASVTPTNTHPKLTKLGVGAIAMGASLIGYDKEAFGSYGLEAGENGAVSEENAAAYRAALDALLEKAPVLGQMKVAAWFDHRKAEGQALVDAIVEPRTLSENAENFNWEEWDDTEEVSVRQTPQQQEAVANERARKLLTAIRKGEEAEQVTAHYFALAISGASGRAMVRDWKTGKLEQLAQAVVTWFDDLVIVNTSGENAKKPKFKTILLSLQKPIGKKQQEDDYLKAIRNLQLPFWRCAISPTTPIPFGAVVKIVESHRSDMITGEFTEALSSSGSALASSRIYTRMAILRAYHHRQARLQGGYPMQSSLDTEHPSTAYHCGRLMYLLAELQKKSAGDKEINAGVIQRYYGAASSTPNLVIGRLIALSQHHLNKLSPSYAYWWQGQLGGALNSIKQELPKSLNPKDQSLFALGYYHQLVFSRSSKSKNPEPDTDIPVSSDDQSTDGNQ